jgi:hypothetical protein
VSSHSLASAIWETLTRRRRHSADVQAYQGRLQVIIDDRGVDHRRAQVRMPERLLGQANIFRLPIELGREGMPAHVWVHILVPQPGFLPPPLHHGAPRGAIDRCAFPHRKEEAAWARGAARPPAAQFLQEGFIEPEDAVFLAFPLADGELAAAPVDIVDRQRQHLSGAQAGMQHELHETAIAVPGQISRVRALQQSGHLGTGQDGGQAARMGHGTLLVAAAVIWLTSSVWRYFRYAYTYLFMISPSCLGDYGLPGRKREIFGGSTLLWSIRTAGVSQVLMLLTH